MGKLIRGINDLATVNSELAKEWNYEKNGDLKPEDFTCGSGKKVWWKQSYDDPKTGKHFDFEWQANISNRNKGAGCPFLPKCANPAVWEGFNDLATVNPELAKEWHPIKNKNLKPTDMLASSEKKVWWLYPYDDPKTGKHFDFEWEASIAERNKGTGCPYLSSHAVWEGFNDLATINPELAKQWHPTKNGELKPTDVTSNSNKKVWWLYSYDDPKTGKHFDFEWKTTVYCRNIGNGCPFLSKIGSNIEVWYGFNDLATINPELAKQWHPTKNGELKPTDVTSISNKKVWWLLPYDDPKTGKHFDFEWKASINYRHKEINCPYLSGREVFQGFNDLATINPELAKQWHPTKNRNLRPTDVTTGSHKQVWWLYPYDDPITGKHFNFEWKATISGRSRGSGCPFLGKNQMSLYYGFNDLATINPELAKQWHPTKNGELKPTDVTASSEKKVWWLLPYDDPKTGKHFNFEWEATIKQRKNGNGCPFLSGRGIWQGFNDLATVNPELAKEWHPTKNGELKPTDVTSNSSRKVWWYLSYNSPKTYKHYDFEWQASICNRSHGSDCPFLSSSKTEILIHNLMKKRNILFKTEKTFKNCKDVNLLPFDIYLPNENIIIECDGMQHFKTVEYFGGKKGFKIRKFHDNIKNSFCRENDIPILRIPYTYDSVVDKQKIESLILDFIKTKTVPQEILDYYSQFKFSNYVECVEELNKKFLC